jgi:hypothetical protein
VNQKGANLLLQWGGEVNNQALWDIQSNAGIVHNGGSATSVETMRGWYLSKLV